MCGRIDDDSIGTTLRAHVGYDERTAPCPAYKESSTHVGENPQPVMGFMDTRLFDHGAKYFSHRWS
jgi:hypothetical protein